MTVLFQPYFSKKLDFTLAEGNSSIGDALFSDRVVLMDNVTQFITSFPNTITKRPLATGEIISDYQVTQPYSVLMEAVVTDREFNLNLQQYLAGDFSGFTFFGRSKPAKAISILLNIYLQKGYLRSLRSKYLSLSDLFVEKIDYEEDKTHSITLKFKLFKARTPIDVPYSNPTLNPDLDLF